MIVVNNLSKYFGEQKALDCVTFEAKKGRILGLLGPNGAGKSTLMKIITGYIAADEGDITIMGNAMGVNKPELQSMIGYLPEHNPLYLEMYVKEYLSFVAGIYKTDKIEIDRLIALVGLSPEKHKKIKQLSKGYRQRVGLAAALIPNPEVLILDEPTTGLDPNQIIEVRELIKSLSVDKVVILSTHLMQEVQSVCDDILIINHGKVVANDTVENIKNAASVEQQLQIEFMQNIDIDILKNGIEGISDVTQLEGNNIMISISTAEDIRPIISQFAAVQGWTILMMRKIEKDLENIFAQLTHN